MDSHSSFYIWGIWELKRLNNLNFCELQLLHAFGLSPQTLHGIIKSSDRLITKTISVHSVINKIPHLKFILKWKARYYIYIVKFFFYQWRCRSYVQNHLLPEVSPLRTNSTVLSSLFQNGCWWTQRWKMREVGKRTWLEESYVISKMSDLCSFLSDENFQ